MNLLNYMDRLVPSAVKVLLKTDLGIDYTHSSMANTAFIVVYMLASPVFGTLADRWPRRVLLASGVALWTLATGAAAFATGFASFLVARSLVGIGEAAYATIAPALLGDFFPPARRNRVLTIFYVAMPVGAAVGFALGSFLGHRFGWRTAFLACGLPGVLTALLALRIRDPGRGTFDEGGAGEVVPWPSALPMLLRNRVYVVTVAGYAAVTFAAGGMGDYLVAFLEVDRGMGESAGTLVGITTVVGGLGGTAMGGLLADRLRGRTRHPYLALSALSLVPATLFAVVAIRVEGKAAIATCILLAQFFLWFYNGPINTILVNSVPAALRVRAFGLSILTIHLLGDAVSPPIIGWISESRGGGHLPQALLLVPLAMAVGCAIWMLGWRRLAEPGAPPAPATA
jgi:predicted MFS family arabinose efflux permease